MRKTCFLRSESQKKRIRQRRNRNLDSEGFYKELARNRRKSNARQISFLKSLATGGVVRGRTVKMQVPG